MPRIFLKPLSLPRHTTKSLQRTVMKALPHGFQLIAIARIVTQKNKHRFEQLKLTLVIGKCIMFVEESRLY